MYEKMNSSCLEKVIRFAMDDFRRPPWGLGCLRVELLRDSRYNLAAVIGKVDLLAGLDKLDVCLGQDAAVGLFQALKGPFVVLSEKGVVLDRKHCLWVAVYVEWYHVLVGYFLPLYLSVHLLGAGDC
jgi:hypothetical protein